MRLLAVILLCVLGAATPAFAQQDDDEESVDVGTVVVEADPLQAEPAPADDEQAVEVQQSDEQPAASAEVAQTVGREEFESGALDAADRVLEREPGFVVDDTFAGSAVSYHGLPGKFSEVTVDGQ